MPSEEVRTRLDESIDRYRMPKGHSLLTASEVLVLVGQYPSTCLSLASVLHFDLGVVLGMFAFDQRDGSIHRHNQHFIRTNATNLIEGHRTF